MRYGVILVVLLTIFASCGTSSPATSPGDSHALPAKGGRTAAPQGDLVEKIQTIRFPDGSVDEYIESEWDNTGKKLVKQERLSASRQVVEEIQYVYYDDGPNLSTKNTLDDSNRLKSRVVYRYDNNTRADANLILEAFVSSKGKQVSANEYTYDNAGNMLSRVFLSASNTRLTETNYNWQNGVIVSSETKDAVRGNTISRAQNEYDGNKNLIKQTIYGPNNQVSRIIEAVWQDGKQVEEKTTGANRQVQIRITSEYGPAGQLVKKTIENIEGGGMTQILEYEYSVQQTGRR